MFSVSSAFSWPAFGIPTRMPTWCITLGSDLILYLFGTPGQDRFWYLWEDLSAGAVGAVVMIDTRRVEDCFSASNVRAVPASSAFDAGSGSTSTRGGASAEATDPRQTTSATSTRFMRRA